MTVATFVVIDYCSNLSTVKSPSYILLFQGFTDDQLMLVEQNTVMVEEREREIRQIVQSISDLNEIFRDLAGMVVEQVFNPVLMCLQGKLITGRLLQYMYTQKDGVVNGLL